MKKYSPSSTSALVDNMQVKHLTLKQCRQLIENNFLGAHDKKGKQVDYHDYRQQILNHYWSLMDKKLDAQIKNYDKAHAEVWSKTITKSDMRPLETEKQSTLGIPTGYGLTSLEHAKIFNKFRHIAQCIEINSY